MQRISWKWFGMTAVFSEAKYGLLSYAFDLHLWLLQNMTMITHDGGRGLYAMCVRLLSWTSWARWTSWWSTPPPPSTSGPFSCRSTLQGSWGGEHIPIKMLINVPEEETYRQMCGKEKKPWNIKNWQIVIGS
jgi:hypothetical protein